MKNSPIETILNASLLLLLLSLFPQVTHAAAKTPEEKGLEIAREADRRDAGFMVNHQTGKSTSLEFTNYMFGIGLKDRDFTKNSLKGAR